jgi:hypothetical protein
MANATSNVNSSSDHELKSSSNLGKRKQEVRELLAMERKRKRISTSGSGSSSEGSEPSDSSSHATGTSNSSPLPADVEAEKSRLLYLFDQVDKTVLMDGLKNAIKEGSRPLIESVSKVFDASVFPPQSSLTCARCEQPFDPSYNSITSCKLYHPGEEIDRIHKFRNGSMWQCDVCNKTWNSDDCCDFFGVDTGFCFVGPHTAVEYELDEDFECEDDLEDVKRKKYW